MDLIRKLKRFGGLFLGLLESKLKLNLPLPIKLRWHLAHKSEIDFWDRYFKTGGLEWKEAYPLKFKPDFPLQKEISVLLPKGKKEVRILDVGAGPLTYLGKVHKDISISIDAVDPLADEYDRLLKKYNIVPPVRTKYGSAENLSELFCENHYDLVFARNCIDHSYNAEKAILEMLKVVKHDCFVLLAHIPNEAENENYKGLHQWNFDVKNGDFVISSKKSCTNFTKKYADICVVTCSILNIDNVDWLYTSILKINSPSS